MKEAPNAARTKREAEIHDGGQGGGLQLSAKARIIQQKRMSLSKSACYSAKAHVTCSIVLEQDAPILRTEPATTEAP